VLLEASNAPLHTSRNIGIPAVEDSAHIFSFHRYACEYRNIIPYR
jgi:hypothetical protein